MKNGKVKEYAFGGVHPAVLQQTPELFIEWCHGNEIQVPSNFDFSNQMQCRLTMSGVMHLVQALQGEKSELTEALARANARRGPRKNKDQDCWVTWRPLYYAFHGFADVGLDAMSAHILHEVYFLQDIKPLYYTDAPGNSCYAHDWCEELARWCEENNIYPYRKGVWIAHPFNAKEARLIIAKSFEEMFKDGLNLVFLTKRDYSPLFSQFPNKMKIEVKGRGGKGERLCYYDFKHNGGHGTVPNEERKSPTFDSDIWVCTATPRPKWPHTLTFETWREVVQFANTNRITQEELIWPPK